MNLAPRLSGSINRTGIALVLMIWLLGFLVMRLPLGDAMLRASYDWLHLTGSHHSDPQVVLVTMNEDTDRKLGRKQGETFSRDHHTLLLDRLKQAGAERVCYDILFDLPAADPAVDERLASAIRAHGRVILGGAEEAIRKERGISQQVVLAPAPALREAAEGWGLLNVSAKDADGVVRRFDHPSELAPAFAIVAALAEKPELQDDLPGKAWLHYPTLPNDFTAFEFADCLDKNAVPDDALRGKTVFVGGQYATEPYGSRDLFATPYRRFGMPDIPGLAWHATVFLNARDNLWLEPAGNLRAAIWCLPFAAAAWLLLANKRAWLVLATWLVLGALLMVAAVYLGWNDRVLVNWMVPIGVQLPLCVVGLVIQRAALPRFRYLPPALRCELENVEVFISFSTTDKVVATGIKDLLDVHDHPAWLCVHNIVAGTSWPQAIAVALEKCKVVLFIKSRHSLLSNYCLNELRIASDRSTPILVLSLDHEAVPIAFDLLLGSTQRVNANELSDDVAHAELLSGINKLVGTKRRTDVQCDLPIPNSHNGGRQDIQIRPMK